eukprot:sb/3461963/
MGAALSGYLESPVTDKEVQDGLSKLGLSYGASSMQGWRVGNEDAVSCVPELTSDSALFAVFDGHGGPEVAQFVAKYLPDLIKEEENFEKDSGAALLNSFLKMDKMILAEEHAEELQELAGTKDDDEEDTTEDKLKECVELNAEADMPIEEILEKYQKEKSDAEQEEEEKKEPVFEGKGKGKKKGKEGEEGEEEAAANGASENGEESAPGASAVNKNKAAGILGLLNGGLGGDIREMFAKGLAAKLAEAGDEDDSDEDADEDYEEGGSGEEEEGESEEESESGEEDDEDEEEEEVDVDEREGYGSGCTACVALIRDSVITVANVGDSRAVICTAGGVAKELSQDHKPEDELEKARVEKAGGKITKDGRINGGLNLARALGDHQYKQNEELKPEEQLISPLPDLQTHTIAPDDEFLLVACDGIWNVMSSEESVAFVRERIEAAKKEGTCSKTWISDIGSEVTVLNVFRAVNKECSEWVSCCKKGYKERQIATLLGQSCDVDLLLKKELIDLKAIPLPGHSNGSLQPPKKFTAGTAMEKSVISGSRGKTKGTRVISVLELVGDADHSSALGFFSTPFQRWFLPYNHKTAMNLILVPTPPNSRTLITLVPLVFPLLLSKDGFHHPLECPGSGIAFRSISSISQHHMTGLYCQATVQLVEMNTPRTRYTPQRQVVSRAGIELEIRTILDLITIGLRRIPGMDRRIIRTCCSHGPSVTSSGTMYEHRRSFPKQISMIQISQPLQDNRPKTTHITSSLTRNFPLYKSAAGFYSNYATLQTQATLSRSTPNFSKDQQVSFPMWSRPFRPKQMNSAGGRNGRVLKHRVPAATPTAPNHRLTGSHLKLGQEVATAVGLDKKRRDQDLPPITATSPGSPVI